MESYEVVKLAIDRKGPKEIAEEMGVSLSMVYKWAQPPENAEPGKPTGSGTPNPLDRVEQLMASTNEPQIIEWLCHKAGGHFVQNPEQLAAAGGYDVVPATNEILHQFSELLNEVTKAAEDNYISNDESVAIREVWNKLKCFTESFVVACEEGNFKNIRTHGPSGQSEE